MSYPSPDDDRRGSSLDDLLVCAVADPDLDRTRRRIRDCDPLYEAVEDPAANPDTLEDDHHGEA